MCNDNFDSLLFCRIVVIYLFVSIDAGVTIRLQQSPCVYWHRLTNMHVICCLNCILSYFKLFVSFKCVPANTELKDEKTPTFQIEHDFCLRWFILRMKTLQHLKFISDICVSNYSFRP